MGAIFIALKRGPGPRRRRRPNGVSRVGEKRRILIYGPLRVLLLRLRPEISPNPCQRRPLPSFSVVSLCIRSIPG